MGDRELISQNHVGTLRFRAYGPPHIGRITERYRLASEVAETVRLFSLVLPFRVNDYVLSELIDWEQVPDDPIFQLVFPQPGMLRSQDERRLAYLSRNAATGHELARFVDQVRARMNPHPAGQMELNVPREGSEVLPGIQHKYRDTVLYFPSNGQTCHAYCTYCFRWAQFVGDPDLRFGATGPDQLIEYLGRHPEVTDVLVTGGDPMVMSAAQLRRHIEPLLAVDSLQTIRIGTKSLAYWPRRFVTDADADDTLRLFEELVASGRNLAIMAHFSHPREIQTDLARTAVGRIRSAGAMLYCQAPLMAHVNDDADTWATLWRAEQAVGAIPYYLFVARDTGAQEYFKVPLVRALEIFQQAYRELPGLARTVRGPVMSTAQGKVLVDGIVGGPTRPLLQLRFLRARDPCLVGRPFHARYSSSAAWFDDLSFDATLPSDIAAAISDSTALLDVGVIAPSGQQRSSGMSEQWTSVAANLALDEAVARRRAAGEPIVHLGFGESRLPVFPGLLQRVVAGADRTEYGPVAGDLGVRTAAARYFARRRIPTQPDQVVVGPGSKSLLMAVVAAVPGDVLLPKPSWVTYAPQAQLFERSVHFVAIPDACGGVPEPALLVEAISDSRAAGLNPRLLVVTLPDNPTGTIAPPHLVRRLCEIAEQEDLVIVSDEIYRDVVFDATADVLSPAELLPERTVVTTGLSKSLALGGWRIGAARVPAGPWGRRVRQRMLGVASQVWSSLAGPMQAVAEYAFSEPAELRAHIMASTRLHASVASSLHQVITSYGLSCRRPTGGFYLYPDLEPVRESLALRGVVDSASLEQHLLQTYGVAVLGGHHFGDEPSALRFRAATSLLYGDTNEQRWLALRADDPPSLPHIAELLTQLDNVFGKLSSG